MGHIQRVGLISKHHLDASAGVLAELAGWLEARDVRAVFEAETAALVGLPPGRPTAPPAERRRGARRAGRMARGPRRARGIRGGNGGARRPSSRTADGHARRAAEGL